MHRELERKRQVILQGPPGAGKTYRALQYVQWLSTGVPEATRLTTHTQRIPPDERSVDAVVNEVISGAIPLIWEIVQFHPSYTYEDFVRGIEAVPEQGQVSFRAVNKTLGWLASVAQGLASRAPEVLVVSL